MFFNTNISPPAVNVEPDDDEYVTNNQYLTSYEEDEDEADAFYDQVNRKYWDDSSSDEEEDMNEDDGFGKHTHTLGEYDSEENNAFGYPAIGSSSMNSKYYTASSPDDFHEQPSPPGASFAEDFNPFGFASTNESFSSPEASTNDSFEEPTDFSAAFANFGHPSPDVDNSVENETVDPFGATSSSDPFDPFDPFADAPAASTGTTSEPVDESSPADASDPFATAEPVEDPFA